MLLHEKRRSKRVEKSAITTNILTHNRLQNPLIFPVFTTSRDVVYKYAKGEGVFVKKKDNWNSALSTDVLYPYDDTAIVSLGRDLSRSDTSWAQSFNVFADTGRDSPRTETS